MARKNDPLLLDEFQAKTEAEGRGLFRFDRGDSRGTIIRGFDGGFTRANSINAQDFTSEQIISTSDLDRYDSVILQDGWQLEDFQANPVVFWGHEDWKLPIGMSLGVFPSMGQTRAKTRFAVNESPQRVGEIWALHVGGYLRAWSVGWIPLEWEEFHLEIDGTEREGVRFIKNELLEYSLVGLPGNAGALTLARVALASAKRHGATIPSSDLPGDLGILSRACQLAATSDDLAADVLERSRMNERLIRALEGAHPNVRLAPESGCSAIAALESAYAELRDAGEAILAAR